MKHSRKLIALVCGLVLGALFSGVAAAAETLPLDAVWRFAIDNAQEGVRKQWFKTRLPDTIRLPGTTEENGKGPLNERRTTDSWTHIHQTPGTAWYQRDIEVPASWAGQRLTLTLERTKRTRLWVDDREIGRQDGICTAQVYDLGSALAPGKHVLTIMVSTGPFPKGIGGHHLGGMQGNWNGIIGRIELMASGPVWIEKILVSPNVGGQGGPCPHDDRQSHRQPLPRPVDAGGLRMRTAKRGTPRRSRLPFSVAGSGETVEYDYPLGNDALLWDEFSPALYKLTVSLGDRPCVWPAVTAAKSISGSANFAARARNSRSMARPCSCAGRTTVAASR